jgi:hypothetical protein
MPFRVRPTSESGGERLEANAMRIGWLERWLTNAALGNKGNTPDRSGVFWQWALTYPNPGADTCNNY